MKNSETLRDSLKQARRVVVKVGSRVLVQSNGRPDMRRLRALVKDLSAIRGKDRDVVLVSSGAVSAGLEALKVKTRPTNLPDLQMAAAVGQTRLMSTYGELFAARKCRVGQLLLTAEDLKDRRRHLNARNTIMNLLRHRIVPIVNENDVVSIDEIKFGDNDMLAALVTHLIQADLLIVLTTSDGLREPLSARKTRRVSHLPGVSTKAMSWVRDKTGTHSTGGMASKLEAAKVAVSAEAWVVIADGRKANTLSQLLEGKDIGTLITSGRAADQKFMSGRKRWIAFFQKVQGTLTIDDGARDALLKKGKSLLPIGIRRVEGDFKTGAVVRVCGTDGNEVARGLVEYASSEIKKIKGHRTAEIKGLLGSKDYDEVIHRDNMAVISDDKEK